MIYQLEELYKLKGQKFAIDTETDGLYYFRNGLIGISIHCPALDMTGYIFTCDYVEKETGKGKLVKLWEGDMEINPLTGRKRRVYTQRRVFTKQLTAVPDREKQYRASAILAEVASDPNTMMVFHNSKFDLHFLRLDLLDKPCTFLDTSVMAHLYDSRLRKSMDNLEAKFLGKNSKRSHVAEAPKKLKNKIWLWPPEICADYAQNDALVTWQLYEAILPYIRQFGLVSLLRTDMEYTKILWHLEERGMIVDMDFCKTAIEAFSKNLTMMEKDLEDEVGTDVNWRSHQQLSVALYDNLGWPKPKNPFEDEFGVDHSHIKGKYNKWNTSSFLLMEKAQHPLGPLVMDLRESWKLRGNVEKYMELADDRNIIHSDFNITGTRTGRLSSKNPNLQNVASQHRVRETQSVYSGGSIRQEEYNLRRAFKARPGYTFVSIDHKQQEQRMFAILAEEPIMLQALKERKDIHLMIALAVWGDCGPETNKLHREWSKTISFGLLYGMTTASLKVRLNKTDEEADKITTDYWTTFPRIKPYLDEVKRTMDKYQFVRYWSGRIWREWDDMQYYKGCNARIQGGAADLIKLALMRAFRVLNHQGWGTVVTIVHDEIICEIKNEYVEEAIPVLMRIMEVEDIFGLPFAADVKIGPSYGEMDEVKPSRDPSSIRWEDYAPPLDMKKYALKAWESGKETKWGMLPEGRVYIHDKKVTDDRGGWVWNQLRYFKKET